MEQNQPPLMLFQGYPNRTVKWKNMQRQNIKKPLMAEFLSGIMDS